MQHKLCDGSLQWPSMAGPFPGESWRAGRNTTVLCCVYADYSISIGSGQSSVWALGSDLNNWLKQGLVAAAAFASLWSLGGKHCCALRFDSLPLTAKFRTGWRRGQMVIAALNLLGLKPHKRRCNHNTTTPLDWPQVWLVGSRIMGNLGQEVLKLFGMINSLRKGKYVTVYIWWLWYGWPS